MRKSEEDHFERDQKRFETDLRPVSACVDRKSGKTHHDFFSGPVLCSFDDVEIHEDGKKDVLPENDKDETFDD